MVQCIVSVVLQLQTFSLCTRVLHIMDCSAKKMFAPDLLYPLGGIVGTRLQLLICCVVCTQVLQTVVLAGGFCTLENKRHIAVYMYAFDYSLC
jgi:hypothetical protein